LEILSGMTALGFTYSLALGYALAGKPDEALTTLEQGLEGAKRSGMEVWLAMMYLLKGRLLESKSNSEEAENCFRTSIELARRQCAKSPELRATTSLARLLRDTARCDEARTMLAEIYNWFTEGFDTADLKDAKALLEELSSSP
jgi:tetratricopeptide (TPR) repeat protein